MIDPQIIRDKPDEIRHMLQCRHVDYDLDTLIQYEQRRRKDISLTDKLRQEKNDCGRRISDRKKSGGDATDIINHMQKVSSRLRAQESIQATNEEKYQELIRTVPNMIHDTVPTGPDETANLQIKRWGNTANKPNNHIDVAGKLLDIERAAKVAGSRFYYLKDGLVRLNYALISYALDHLSKYGYTLVQPPYMINRQSMEGAIIAEDFEDVIYKIQDKDLYMIGTSEHAMAAMHSNEILDGKTLPVRYAGVSPCFRKEAGAHGKDQKGIFRVHQFEKVEQFAYARPEESWDEHQRMLRISEEFYENLEIPYRTVILSSGDMGKVASKTCDIEAWMAGQSAYREVGSCSNCTEYQARRLMIRYRDRTNDKPQYLHTLNSTLVATTRTMVAIMENHQRDDGHIDVPKSLQPYMNLKTI